MRLKPRQPPCMKTPIRTGEQAEIAQAAPAEAVPSQPPQFEPLVGIIAHEARGVEMTGDIDVPEFEYDAQERIESAAASGDEYDFGYSPSYQRTNGSAAYHSAALRCRAL